MAELVKNVMRYAELRGQKPFGARPSTGFAPSAAGLGGHQMVSHTIDDATVRPLGLGASTG
jgi:hypothetical protein